MFFQQLHDCDVRPRRDARFASVNVQLEQSAHRIDFRSEHGAIQRRDVVVVDRVLIDAVQRTQQLARACAVACNCAMQRSQTIFFEQMFLS